MISGGLPSGRNLLMTAAATPGLGTTSFGIPELARGMFAAYDFHSRGLRPFREISRDAIQRAIQQPHPHTKLVQQFGGGHAGNPGSHNNREVARFHRPVQAS